MKNITIQSFVGFLMAAIVFAFFVLVFDAASKGENHDLILDKREWSCVESKQERYTSTAMVGKVPVTRRHTREVCITLKRN